MASRSSNFVMEFGDLAIDSKDSGHVLQGSSMTLWTNSYGTVNSKSLRERYGSSPHKTLSLIMNFLSLWMVLLVVQKTQTWEIDLGRMRTGLPRDIK